MRQHAIRPVHISTIKPGDTVEHAGHLKTVCAADLKQSGFMGLTLFGDSYRLGTLPVRLAVLQGATR